ncbi:MAG: inositol-3-phosphate synthase [Pirellulales bacterium]|nr:inositol-3-phosphate synthase [Pirellulales bacterium]
MTTSRIGIWLIGAKGGVATTAIVGAIAIKKKIIGKAGLVSELPQFQKLPLPPWEDFVIAGHEIRRTHLADEAKRLVAESRTITSELFEQIRGELAQIDRRIRPGTIRNVGSTISALADWGLPDPASETPRQAVERLRRDMADFVEKEKIEHLISVNVTSTEPHTLAADSLPTTWPELEKLLDDPQACPLPASSLYAIAALGAGYSYLNFTPSLGASPAAIDDLAIRQKTRHYGCDGKTGETLMKSVLAPMFARRNLQVLSWVGHNIFGNLDGQVLSDPANKHGKVASKDHLIREILGYKPHTLVSIEYVPDLGDWKTAWDHVHFHGFLGVPMTLQFTWQGCDSALAAPLVLDMIRFTDLARRRGETGQMKFLASFFKSPYGVTEHNFERQFQWLEAWADKIVA